MYWKSAESKYFVPGQIEAQPHLVQKTFDPTTKQITETGTKILKQNFISPQTLAIVKSGMRQCVTDGSCKLLGRLPFTSGGKTGTAQWNRNKDNHAWFTAFAPYDNPQIVVTVLVEEGKEGSEAAMPIANDFLRWWGESYLTY